MKFFALSMVAAFSLLVFACGSSEEPPGRRLCRHRPNLPRQLRMYRRLLRQAFRRLSWQRACKQLLRHRLLRRIRRCPNRPRVRRNLNRLPYRQQTRPNLSRLPYLRQTRPNLSRLPYLRQIRLNLSLRLPAPPTSTPVPEPTSTPAPPPDARADTCCDAKPSWTHLGQASPYRRGLHPTERKRTHS